MSECALCAWLCLLIDWILFNDLGTATLNQQHRIEAISLISIIIGYRRIWQVEIKKKNKISKK